ncbi:MAG: 30S ribosomal protein S21 [Candidatus Staskawiczbacteria bacterium CG10_big_fil_rev_8_21_14_0_10_38_10]|uniref:30S ribosomal protein S21 n=1 Tax=Candidatus Staskawiczbacteria bacterium CG10_big_fil_rev_8_21_14_0_10_38_10 TaxID=1974891 RepID=A0A2H9T247_9BACT|nr:MAG: 30S ribosomal protein S21 [Candidatus Staskawiczbacteria bacterium CG10_big_fil_rev_8_21_14_0_10_38_10]
MALRINRKERETSQNVIRRFTKAIRQSGILLEARKRQFQRKRKSRLARKLAALRKEKIKKEYARMKKLGKIESGKIRR